ncbi:MAG: lipopolysaccharide biosynthesis protein [Clostridia bacterium]|nr:lipopolysaccharide biosynthesis protein [Clostridia bacterium]
MINILLCGNQKVFDGALTELISITNRTKDAICCYIFTMDVSRIKADYTCITDEQVAFLNEVVKLKNKENQVIKVDVTELYEKEFGNCKNESAYCTPYTLLRLLADMVPNIPDKLLYLDIDMMAYGDISELYNTDISEYEYAAVKEKYGCIFIWPDYINAGMLLFNMKKIRKTGLLQKARHLIKTKKMLFADQDAVYYSTTQKLLLPRKFNEQSSFKREDTIICHFCKRLMWLPYPHTENYKQWQIDGIHKELKCYIFDKDLAEYTELKSEFEKRIKEAMQ